MARPTWKGNISFGLVNIPVSLFPGEKRTDLSFRLLDSKNQARIRYERVNEVTGEEVPWDRIVKAYEFEDGNYVMLTEEDFERAAVEQTKSVDIEDFVDAQDIPIPFFDKPYYLVPAKQGQKAYVLLREALKKTGKVGIAKVVIRTRQYLAAVVPQGDALLMCVLRFANEIRKPGEFELPEGDVADFKVNDKEIALAEQLIASMTSKWKPDTYHDDYSEKLHEWIMQKAESDGHMPAAEPVEEKKPAGKIIDIMDLLKRSMEQSGRASGGDDPAPAKRAAKKATATKPSPKKTAAKAPAKKATASRAKAKPAAAAPRRKAS
jgi:DNA end-binding protein Ku